MTTDDAWANAREFLTKCRVHSRGVPISEVSAMIMMPIEIRIRRIGR